jgi:hypothetical protein
MTSKIERAIERLYEEVAQHEKNYWTERTFDLPEDLQERSGVHSARPADRHVVLHDFVVPSTIEEQVGPFVDRSTEAGQRLWKRILKNEERLANEYDNIGEEIAKIAKPESDLWHALLNWWDDMQCDLLDEQLEYKNDYLPILDKLDKALDLEIQKNARDEAIRLRRLKTSQELKSLRAERDELMAEREARRAKSAEKRQAASAERAYYAYVWIRDGRPVYVGKGKETRFGHYVKRAAVANAQCVTTVFMSDEEAREAEAALYAAFIAKGYPLENKQPLRPRGGDVLDKIPDQLKELVL